MRQPSSVPPSSPTQPTTDPDVTVTIDDRARLISIVLTLTDFPQRSHERRPHGAHQHARMTRKHFAPYADHPAVRALQGLLDQGAPVESVFTLALVRDPQTGRIPRPPRWMPSAWDRQLDDFARAADVGAWWADQAIVWDKALDETRRVFEGVRFKPFLQPFVGAIQDRFVLLPHIGYPTDRAVGVRIGSDLVCIAPPRLAWGDSAPWPFDDDPAHLYQVAITQFGRLLMIAYLRAHRDRLIEIAATPLPVNERFRKLYPTWLEQFAHLFVAGAVAIYLEDHLDAREANAYVLMERKISGLELLPGLINVFRRYLRQVEEGNYETLFDLLPSFAKQIKVAQRLVTL